MRSVGRSLAAAAARRHRLLGPRPAPHYWAESRDPPSGGGKRHLDNVENTGSHITMCEELVARGISALDIAECGNNHIIHPNCYSEELLDEMQLGNYLDRTPRLIN